MFQGRQWYCIACRLVLRILVFRDAFLLELCYSHVDRTSMTALVGEQRCRKIFCSTRAARALTMAPSTAGTGSRTSLPFVTEPSLRSLRQTISTGTSSLRITLPMAGAWITTTVQVTMISIITFVVQAAPTLRDPNPCIIMLARFDLELCAVYSVRRTQKRL